MGGVMRFICGVPAVRTMRGHRRWSWGSRNVFLDFCPSRTCTSTTSRWTNGATASICCPAMRAMPEPRFTWRRHSGRFGAAADRQLTNPVGSDLSVAIEIACTQRGLPVARIWLIRCRAPSKEVHSVTGPIHSTSQPHQATALRGAEGSAGARRRLHGCRSRQRIESQ